MSQGHQSHEHLPGATHEPIPLDPENEIDAKSTAYWILGSSVVLYISLYLLLPMFDSVMTMERDRKINNRSNLELDASHKSEGAFLRGELSKSKKSIEQVMKEMAGK
jgi:hypothetical protein